MATSLLAEYQQKKEELDTLKNNMCQTLAAQLMVVTQTLQNIKTTLKEQIAKSTTNTDEVADGYKQACKYKEDTIKLFTEGETLLSTIIKLSLQDFAPYKQLIRHFKTTYGGVRSCLGVYDL